MSVKIELTKSSVVENPTSVPMQDLNENMKEDNPVEENPTSFLPKETKTSINIFFLISLMDYLMEIS